MFTINDRVIILENAPFYQGCIGKVSRFKNDQHIEVIILGDSNSLPKQFTADELEKL